MNQVVRAPLRPGVKGALIVVGLLATLGAQTASAQSRCGDPCPEPAAFETARGVALGAGLRASAVSTSALAYTPAALALGNLYHLEGTIDYMPEIKTVALGAGVVDSSTSKLGAGVGLRGFLSGEGGHDGLDGRLGLAFPLSDAFAVGLLGRYISLSRDDADGEAHELAEGFTMDASLRIAPTQSVHIDLAALNFIDLDSPYVPVTVSGGLAFSLGEALSLGGDVLADMSSFEEPKLTLGAAAEYLGGGSVPVRGGYSVDLAREIHSLTLGLGYVDQQVGLDISLRQQVSGGDATRVVAAMTYHVH